MIYPADTFLRNVVFDITRIFDARFFESEEDRRAGVILTKTDTTRAFGDKDLKVKVKIDDDRQVPQIKVWIYDRSEIDPHTTAKMQFDFVKGRASTAEATLTTFLENTLSP